MRKVIITLLFAAFTGAAFAQTNQGQWMVGGNLNFNSSKYGDLDDTRVNTLTFNPNAGYFFIDNLAGGLRLSFYNTKVEDEDGFTEFSASPFLRYYFLPATQKVNVFADGSFGIGSSGEDDKESFNQFAFMAGPAIFLTPNTALEFSVGYLSKGGDAYKVAVNGDDKRYNTIGVNVGFQVHLGGKK